MCGIAGVFGPDRERIGGMLRTMLSRGPDACRTQSFESVPFTLGHVRLSILDLDPRSHQPFRSPCGRYWLSFNGEIYNYLDLKARLENEGVAFSTSSDTEALLHWLIRRGRDGVADLDGMFAFTFFDERRRTLLMARDHIGEKPLYFSQSQDASTSAFAFASEIPALLQLPWVDGSLDSLGVTDYLRFLYVPHPNTFYRGVKEMPPGSLAEWRLGEESVAPEPFYRLEDEVETVRSMTYDEAVSGFRREFLESVRLRLQSDVPVGLFLSGGLDSNAILAAAKELGRVDRLNAYTIGYDRRGAADGDESKVAASAAEWFGVQHHVSQFNNDAPIDETVERSLSLFGQPYGNATALVADAIAGEASKHSRVCLVGDGGDELLNGYPRHRALPWVRRLMKCLGPLRGRLASARGFIPSIDRWEVHSNRLKRLTETLGWPLAESFLRWTTFLSEEEIVARTGMKCESGFYEGLRSLFHRFERSPLLAASVVDLKSFVPGKLMPCADRAGMAHSLELRCPFLSPKLVRFALAAPARHKTHGRRIKPMLADAFGESLPAVVRKQPKRPFNPPMRRYLRSQDELLRLRLAAPDAPLADLLDRQFILEKISEFVNRERDHSPLLWGLLTLSRFLEEKREYLPTVPSQTAPTSAAA